MAEEEIPPEPTLEPQPVVEPVSEPEISEIPPEPAVNRLKIILLAVLGLVIVGGLVCVGYKLGQKQNQPGAQPTPILVVVATPTPEPTTDWRTHTFEKITFKHPNSWANPETITTPFGLSSEIKAIDGSARIIVHTGLNRDRSPEENEAFIKELISEGAKALSIDNSMR